MKRIAYFVHGRGRGHASRSLTIVPKIQALGHEFRLFGGGNADDLLDNFAEYKRLAPVMPDLSGPRVLPRRFLGDVRRLRRFRPHLVISDGDMPSVLAARWLGIPSLAIGHDLVFWRCRLPTTLPKKHLRAERLSGLVASRATFGIAVHFLPAEILAPNTYLARPALRPTLEGAVEDGEHILCYFRDPIGRRVLSEAESTGARFIAFGDDLGQLPDIPIQRFDQRRFSELLRSCRAVIASAGSTLLAECILLGKPVMALHKRRDSEQLLNSILIERARVGARCQFESVTAKDIERFITGVERKSYQQIDLANEVRTVPEVVVEVLSKIL